MAVGSGDLGSLVPGEPPKEPTEDKTDDDVTDDDVADVERQLRELAADGSDRDPRRKTGLKETRRDAAG